MAENKDPKEETTEVAAEEAAAESPVEEKPAESAPAEKPAPAEKEEKKEVKLSTAGKKIVEQIEKLSVLELADLVKALEDRFGVSASAPAMMMAAPGAAGEAVEEKTEFNVSLDSAGSNKIGVIKVVRELTSLGLKEAKDIVDAAPKIVKENVKKAEAEGIVAKLKEAGAEASLK